eukprot:4329494-Prymnesium_polylepis.1
MHAGDHVTGHRPRLRRADLVEDGLPRVGEVAEQRRAKQRQERGRGGRAAREHYRVVRRQSQAARRGRQRARARADAGDADA